MPAPAPAPATAQAYLAALPADKRAALEEVRKAIKAAAPKAEEVISYGIPTFRLHGRMLGSYGAAAKHCALYGFVGANKDLLKNYDTSPGTIRFPADKPLPATLVKALVKEQVARVEASIARKGTSSQGTLAKKSVAGAGRSLVKSAAKSAVKSAAKTGVKKLVKKVVKEIVTKVLKKRAKKVAKKNVRK